MNCTQTTFVNVSPPSTYITDRVVHNLPFVDSETFIKLLIDFIVYKDLTESGDPEQLKSKLPLTSAGDVYFFNPEQQPKV